jgi:hypothetical protein
MVEHILKTGLSRCFDSAGREIDCSDTGQDADMGIGLDEPEPRFRLESDTVLDRLTGLCWTMSAATFELPMPWAEALEAIQELNSRQHLGYSDWRLPSRRELRSLIDHGASRPALPQGHPFRQVSQTWYWTSTSSAMYPAYAWYVHMEGGRMFWGAKDRDYLVWPVRGRSRVIPQTGETVCFDNRGRPMECAGSGADGELRPGAAWPSPRFQPVDDGILDGLTGLVWSAQADLGGTADWLQALERIEGLRQQSGRGWHLPNINQLESLVDASRASPALPDSHPFGSVQEVYWSSTSSGFEPDWAFGLYMFKGAVGVGRKQARFAVWPVRMAEERAGSSPES